MSSIGAVVDVGKKERGREQEEMEGEENEYVNISALMTLKWLSYLPSILDMT
jgi:hypothetical protein